MNWYWLSIKNHHTGEVWEMCIQARSKEHAFEVMMRRKYVRRFMVESAEAADGPHRLTFRVIHDRFR